MSWLTVNAPSLLDTIGRHPAEWWLVYGETDVEWWWNRWLKPGFRHVHAMRRDGRVWVEVRPHAEFANVDIRRTDATPWDLYPGHRIQHVIVMRTPGRLRAPFFMGPLTCVELIKTLLGIRSFWLRTPFQLFNYCKRFRP